MARVKPALTLRQAATVASGLLVKSPLLSAAGPLRASALAGPGTPVELIGTKNSLACKESVNYAPCQVAVTSLISVEVG
jgi:hypothetical protein